MNLEMHRLGFDIPKLLNAALFGAAQKFHTNQWVFSPSYYIDLFPWDKILGKFEIPTRHPTVYKN
jgi:hypothetical protein